MYVHKIRFKSTKFKKYRNTFGKEKKWADKEKGFNEEQQQLVLRVSAVFLINDI